MPKTPSNVYGNQSLQLTLALCALQARAIIHYARPNVKENGLVFFAPVSMGPGWSWVRPCLWKPAWYF